jgi:hypothetical protein
MRVVRADVDDHCTQRMPQCAGLSKSASIADMLQRRATVQHGRAERTADERTRRANDQDDGNYDAVPRRAAAEKGSTRTILAEAKRHSSIGAAGE